MSNHQFLRLDEQRRRNRQDGDDEKAMARLADFSFVRPMEAIDHQPARYAIHRAERHIVERQFITTDRAAFLAAHQRALTYFESHPDPDPFLQDQACLYHQLIIDPAAGAERLIALFRQYVGERRLAAAERLTAIASEARQAIAVLQSPRLAEYDDLIAYLQVRLAQYQGRWTDSAETLKALRGKVQLTDRLLPYVARAYGDALANADQFIEAIEQMSVLELNDLVKAIEEKPGTIKIVGSNEVDATGVGQPADLLDRQNDAGHRRDMADEEDAHARSRYLAPPAAASFAAGSGAVSNSISAAPTPGPDS